MLLSKRSQLIWLNLDRMLDCVKSVCMCVCVRACVRACVCVFKNQRQIVITYTVLSQHASLVGIS